MYRALARFGAPLTDVAASDFSDPDCVYQIGIDSNRIDVLSAIDGVSFERAWASRQTSAYGGEPVWVIGLDELIANKRASGRDQDLVDVRLLERRRAAGG